MNSLLDKLDVPGMPWVVRMFFLVLLMLGAFMLVSAFFADGHPAMAQLVPLASDGFKTVLGALVGSLSLAASHAWKGPETTPTDLSVTVPETGAPK